MERMHFTAEALYSDSGIYEAYRCGITAEEIAEIRYRDDLRRRREKELVTPKKEHLRVVSEAIMREYKKEVEKINAH